MGDPIAAIAARFVEGHTTTHVTLSAHKSRAPGWRVITENSWKGDELRGRAALAHVHGRINTIVVLKALAGSYIDPKAEIVWPDGSTGLSSPNGEQAV